MGRAVFQAGGGAGPGSWRGTQQPGGAGKQEGPATTGKHTKMFRQTPGHTASYSCTQQQPCLPLNDRLVVLYPRRLASVNGAHACSSMLDILMKKWQTRQAGTPKTLTMVALLCVLAPQAAAR